MIEVPWWQGDTLENFSYRTCDGCYESVVEDAWAGKSVADFRKFYLFTEDCVVLCEHCLPEPQPLIVAPEP